MAITQDRMLKVLAGSDWLLRSLVQVQEATRLAKAQAAKGAAVADAFAYLASIIDALQPPIDLIQTLGAEQKHFEHSWKNNDRRRLRAQGRKGLLGERTGPEGLGVPDAQRRLPRFEDFREEPRVPDYGPQEPLPTDEEIALANPAIVEQIRKDNEERAERLAALDETRKAAGPIFSKLLGNAAPEVEDPSTVVTAKGLKEFFIP